MVDSAWMLEVGKTSWQLCAEPSAAKPLMGQTFEACALLEQSGIMHDALKETGYGGQPIVLALESSWCLAATLVVNRSQELRDRQTMLFRFEESIPWGVEDCVTDYRAVGAQAFMVAAPNEPLAEFIRSLEASGVCIQCILPAALLATLEHLDQDDWPSQHTVALGHPGWIDLVDILDRQAVAWTWLPAVDANQELLHRATVSGKCITVIGYGLEETTAAVLQKARSIEFIPQPESAQPNQFAASAAAKILNGRLEAPIDLKQGVFGRKRKNAALRRYAIALNAAAAILVCSLLGSLVYRAHIAERQTVQIAAQQANTFHEVFPNAKVPVGVRTRLESELAKLKGLQGEETLAPSTVSVPTILHRLLRALPTDRRFRLLEIRIEQGRLYLDGEVRDHSDAELIAQRLRAEQFEIASPRTQRLDDQRVSLRITGTLVRAGTLALRGQ